MSVSTGQVADATTFNDAFVSKNTDSTVISVITLNESGSGPQVDNIQQAINDNADAITNHVAEVSSAHAASAISNAPLGNLAATDVQTALDELQTDVDSRATAADITAAKARANHTGTQLASTISDFDTAADARISNARGAINGVASLDGSGLVPTSQLPSYVDDVLEYADLASFPVTGETGKIYVAIDTGLTYRWTGSVYVNISSGAVVSVNGQTGVVVVTKTDVGLSNVDNTSDATKNSAVAVLTNKDIDGGTATDARRITLPKETKANLDALTRKEGTIVYATDQAKAYIDNGLSLVAVGSGSGSGIKNYISNYDAENDTTGWSTYQDSASSSPTDGNGGSANINWTRATSSPLSGVASFLLTKDAANRQGEGVSYGFTIERADQAKVCRIDFDYEVASGTYADSDLTVWLYDVTNAQLIQPSASSILNAIGPQQKQTLSFQTNSNSTSYRLIIHVTSTSASAYTVKFDNVSVVRESAVGLSPVSAKAALSGNQSVASSAATKVLFNTVSFNYGGMYDATNSRFVVSQPGVVDIQASLRLSSVSAAEFFSILIYQNGSQVYRMDEYTDTASVFLEGGDSYKANSGDVFEIYVQSSGDASYQIDAGTSSKVTINMVFGSMLSASDADTRVVAARYSTSAGQSIPNGGSDNIVDFGTKSSDTHGAVTTGASWKYTVRVPGLYRVSSLVFFSSGGGWTNGEESQLSVYKNGVFYAYLYVYVASATHTSRVALNGSTTVEVGAGDYLDIRLYQGSGAAITLVNSGNINYVDIERISGPAQIAANEKIAFRASNTAGTSLTGGAGFTDVPFSTESFDTHGAFSTPTFTAPAPGLYEFNFNLYTNGVSMTTSQGFTGRYVVTGKSSGNYDGYVDWGNASASKQFRVGSPLLLDMNAGDTVKVQAATDVTVALNTSSGRNYFQAKRLGGVG